MIDLKNLGAYRENNRIEAKKALGGLPNSIWETYSAFANTFGGYILLGVIEKEDKSFETVDLANHENLITEFRRLLNDEKKVSVNLLAHDDVSVKTVDGNRIVVIYVPRAGRIYKPVYIDGDPKNAYRRSGEGDYKCDKAEYEAMVRDAAAVTQDMTLLTDEGMNVIDLKTVGRFRERVQLSKRSHISENLSDEDFLAQSGAAGAGTDGAVHPSAAGLLMFGKYREIRKIYPDYGLIYADESGDEEFRGNIFDFFFFVSDKLRGFGTDETRQVMLEALANALQNADYHGKGGIVFDKRNESVRVSNPGGFRINVDDAKKGGISDPRNVALSKMFDMLDICRRAGTGIPNIFRVWRNLGRDTPVIRETLSPDRMELLLPIVKTDEGSGERADAAGRTADEKRSNGLIIVCLTDHASAKRSELAEYTGLSETVIRACLESLVRDKIVVAEGDGEDRHYRLKS